MAIWEKVFRRINWENEPSVASPLDENNLNRGDLALDQIDDRVIELNNRTNNLEGYETRVAILEQQAAESKESAKNSADLSENWAVGTPTGIRTDESTNNSKYYSEQSNDSATESESSKIASESFAHGNTGSRAGEDTDNAQYYYEQCKAAAEGITGALIPVGTLAFEDVPPLSTLARGYMYNISNDFVTTSDFVQGAGYQQTLGTNIYVLLHDGVKKFDILAGTPVTGIKGNKETTYRKGNVNLTPADIGSPTIDEYNEDMGAIKTYNSSDTSTTPTSTTSVALVSSNETLSSFFNKITKVIRNVRYVVNKLGTKNISTIGDGTVTGIISLLTEDVDSLTELVAGKQDKFRIASTNVATFTNGVSYITNKGYKPDVVLLTPQSLNHIILSYSFDESTANSWKVYAVTNGGTMVTGAVRFAMVVI